MTSPRMLKVGGLDYSLTKAGIAILTRCIQGHCVMNVTTVTSTGRATDTLPMRRTRIRGHADAIAHHLGTCDLVIVEGVIPSKGRLLDRYGCFWLTLDRLMELEVPIAVISPDSMKMGITGKTARQLGPDQAKFAVANAVRKLWPDLDPANDNESDGAGLAHLGAVALGWQVSTLARHQQVKWTEWPEFGPGVQLVDLGERVEVDAS